MTWPSRDTIYTAAACVCRRDFVFVWTQYTRRASMVRECVCLCVRECIWVQLFFSYSLYQLNNIFYINWQLSSCSRRFVRFWTLPMEKIALNAVITWGRFYLRCISWLIFSATLCSLLATKPNGYCPSCGYDFGCVVLCHSLCPQLCEMA